MGFLDYYNRTGFGLGSELSADSWQVFGSDTTYTLASPYFVNFYSGYMQPRIALFNGWLENYHNVEDGLLPAYLLQRVANGIMHMMFSKKIKIDSNDEYVNEFLGSRQWRDIGFDKVVKEAYAYAIAGGTSLLKINRKGNGEIRLDALPINKFFPDVDGCGEIRRVKCFMATYNDTVSNNVVYNVCEERFMAMCNDGVERAFVHYMVYMVNGTINTATTPSGFIVDWEDIPASVQSRLKRDFGDIKFNMCDSDIVDVLYGDSDISEEELDELWDGCGILPFGNDIGCRLIKFTRHIPAFPKLPFGQPIADLLMNETFQYDQLKYFERLEVYSAETRTMIPDVYNNPNDPQGRQKALDTKLFTFYDSAMGQDKDNKLVHIQAQLRGSDIRTQKQNILNDVAFALNLSSSSVAGWLSDGTTQKTATEILYERTKTEDFLTEHTSIIQDELQDILDTIIMYYDSSVELPTINLNRDFIGGKQEAIQLYSELYDGGKVTEMMLASKILDGFAQTEVVTLAEYIKQQKEQMQAMAMGAQQQPPMEEEPSEEYEYIY